ncbi:response regulator transcription factor [Nocardia sp. alder85J]|uniref:response regulator transcription factor n=1 Tax=Nocardia sp. alder85J TaxID=2862949 RepID=UPI001CD4EAB7|nr:response regulator transcription factor [Nocardia sp. alder85J]MCX4098083.1 response regulator transcription factor [Nocardia sp. alder85J]
MNDTFDESAPATVLVVDDEPFILDLLGSALRLNGFEVYSAADGAGALSVAAVHRPDIVVLDVMLPDIDGFAVAQQLRSTGYEAPVLFLTARDAVSDRVGGLTAGADDYVSKPFSLEEVVVRLRAILRRTARPEDETERLRYADLVLDADTHQVWRGDTPIRLSPREFDLLGYLLLNAGKVVSRNQILENVWGAGEKRTSRVVETFISHVRQKVDAGGPPLIHTVCGLGYVLRGSDRTL